MKTNKRPNVSSIPLNPSKHPTIPSTPQIPNNSTNKVTLRTCSSTLQRKLCSHYLFPSICPLCMAAHEDLKHLFLSVVIPRLAGGSCYAFFFFSIQWVFDEVFKDNVDQLLVGPYLKPNSQLLWSNAVKPFMLNYGLIDSMLLGLMLPLGVLSLSSVKIFPFNIYV